ncbi:MAG: monovalent cation/H(+) antiporter subunit G [Methanimicrococcus sp.]|nr:monovalent cation/H(+) antiporter subunit G [Methanimicrococcus sp.]
MSESLLAWLDFATIRLYVSYFFILFGAVDLLIGMIGLIRLPDVYNRLHATTKIATTGAFFVLLGILIQEGFTPFGFKAIAIGIFLIMTAPVAGHVIARAAYNINIPPCDQTLHDAYCGKRQGDYCDDYDFHEGSYVYVDLDRDHEQSSAGHFEEHLVEQFSEELTGLVQDIDTSTPDTVHPEDDIIDEEELITGSESPDKAACVFDKFDDELYDTLDGKFDDELYDKLISKFNDNSDDELYDKLAGEFYGDHDENAPEAATEKADTSKKDGSKNETAEKKAPKKKFLKKEK